jgi:phospholipid/cholesterol/gamma-HCH transport system substrate-binding protein
MRRHLYRDFVIGLVYIVVLAALITVSIMFYNKDFTSTVDVTLETRSVGTSLQKGADVEVRGVVVGSVKGISSSGAGGRIELAIDPGQAKHLPENVTAQLLPKTLFGQRYVSLIIPERPSAAHLSSGDVITPDRTVASTELQDVFTHLLPVLQAVKPSELAATLDAVAESLRGEGASIGRTIETLANYLREFAPKVPTMVKDIQQFAEAAKTYTKAAPDLVRALRNFTVTNETLVKERAQFVDLLQNVTSSSNRLATFSETNSQNIITLSRDSLPTLRVVAKYSSEFPCLSRALVDFIPVMDSALGAGTNQPGLHVTLQVIPARARYFPGADQPRFDANGPPSCPQSSGSATGTALSRSAGIGTDNSPQENEVIAEMMAASTGTSPQDFPKWGSLLLGPALRGTEVSLR